MVKFNFGLGDAHTAQDDATSTAVQTPHDSSISLEPKAPEAGKVSFEEDTPVSTFETLKPTADPIMKDLGKDPSAEASEQKADENKAAPAILPNATVPAPATVAPQPVMPAAQAKPVLNLEGNNDVPKTHSILDKPAEAPKPNMTPAAPVMPKANMPQQPLIPNIKTADEKKDEVKPEAQKPMPAMPMAPKNDMFGPKPSNNVSSEKQNSVFGAEKSNKKEEASKPQAEKKPDAPMARPSFGVPKAEEKSHDPAAGLKQMKSDFETFTKANTKGIAELEQKIKDLEEETKNKKSDLMQQIKDKKDANMHKAEEMQSLLKELTSMTAGLLPKHSK